MTDGAEVIGTGKTELTTRAVPASKLCVLGPAALTWLSPLCPGLCRLLVERRRKDAAHLQGGHVPPEGQSTVIVNFSPSPTASTVIILKGESTRHFDRNPLTFPAGVDHLRR